MNVLGQPADDELSKDLCDVTFVTVWTDEFNRKSVKPISIVDRLFYSMKSIKIVITRTFNQGETPEITADGIEISIHKYNITKQVV
jgi:hypothetical protein